MLIKDHSGVALRRAIQNAIAKPDSWRYRLPESELQVDRSVWTVLVNRIVRILIELL